MNFKEYSQPHLLERYSFLWSEARLIVAAIALFLGGVPVLRALVPVPALSGIVGLVLTLAWIISGAASVYLLYRWNSNQKMLFGGKAPLDTAAFFVSVVSGINLGLTGLLGTNIGMSIISNYVVFVIVALIYLATTVYLYRRWNASGQKIFGSAAQK